MPPRLFLECTHTRESAINSGIQRVVRNLINHGPDLASGMGIECGRVVFTDQGWAATGPLEPPGISPGSIGGSPRSLKVRLKESALGPWVAGSWHRIKKIREARNRRGIHGGLQFGQGDTLLLIDSSWHVPYWDSLDAARARGAKIGALVHDVVPIRHPQWCDPALVPVFHDWFFAAAKKVDFFLCVSDSTRQAVVGELNKLAVPGRVKPACAVVYNGCDLDPSTFPKPVRPELTRLFSGEHRPLIMVGTLEPRKNHEQVIDAFETIWRVAIDGDLLPLVIIGKFGWKVRRLGDRIRSSPHLNHRLFWFEDLNDTELDFAYRNSSALISASLAEGFDLPVVESLSRGRPVLASDIPVHREIAGNHAAYFPLGDTEALARMILEFNAGTIRGIEPASGFMWPTWREASRNMLETTMRLIR